MSGRIGLAKTIGQGHGNARRLAEVRRDEPFGFSGDNIGIARMWRHTIADHHGFPSVTADSRAIARLCCGSACLDRGSLLTPWSFPHGPVSGRVPAELSGGGVGSPQRPCPQAPAYVRSLPGPDRRHRRCRHLGGGGGVWSGPPRLVRAVAVPAARHLFPRYLWPGLCPPRPGAAGVGFARWVQSLHGLLTGQEVVLDGKTARRSHDRSHGRSALHTVSAYAGESRLVLALLDLAGATITLDALGCQKELARYIRSQQADYVLTVKENQPALRPPCLSTPSGCRWSPTGNPAIRPKLSSATPWPPWWPTPARQASPSSSSGSTFGRIKLHWRASRAGTAGCCHLSATARSRPASSPAATGRAWRYAKSTRPSVR